MWRFEMNGGHNVENKILTGYPSIDRIGDSRYNTGVSEEILVGTDKKMYDFIKERNAEFENSPAYTYFGKERTFAEFDQKVEECAKALKSYGLNTGDCISVCLPNIPETMIYFYACNRIGVTPYLIDPRCTLNRIVDCMKISNSKLLVSVLDIMNKTVKADAIPSDKIVVVSPGSDFLTDKNQLNKESATVKRLYCVKESLYELMQKLSNNTKIVLQKDFLKFGKNYGELTDSLYDPDIPAVIVNTSGTTGTPKGAMESNKGYNITAKQIDYIYPYLSRGMTYFGYIPFFSMYGSAIGMHSALSHGIVVDLIPKLNAAKFDKIFVDKKPNIAISVPKLYGLFPDSKYIKDADLSFAKLLVMGGDNISPAKLDNINTTLAEHGCNEKITFGYGSTESMLIATTTSDPTTHKSGGCGILYPGVNVRITDRNTLEELPYGEEGEIYADTPSMFMGYIGNETESNNAIFMDPDTRIKYYKTGDKGYIDEDGILFTTGRYKRLMKRPDGHQVSSIPIENAIGSCDEVRDCVVVGIKSSYQDEGVIPTAFIELEKDVTKSDALSSIIAKEKETLSGEREMALAYTIVERLPYTINGKADFSTLEKVKFEDIDYVIIDDPIFDGYFTRGENPDRIKLNNSKNSSKKMTK